MLLNLSNHPSVTWSQKQIEEAKQKYGHIQDMAFPDINPEWSLDQVQLEAEKYYVKIRAMAASKIITVHLMG
ncbi:hypothetical protein V6O07_17960, partial [Arthrospira platensis SPKY2]